MSKGGGFEREICTAFSLWFTEGKRDDIFWRTDGSGARATQRRKNGKTTEGQDGDMAASDPIGKPLIDILSVEMKTGYATKTKQKDGTVVITHWSILDLLDSKQKLPMFMEMWEQAIRDATETNREPVLIFRRNRRAACICFTVKMFSEFKDNWGWPCITVPIMRIRGPRTDYGNEIIILPLKEFFEWTESGPALFFELLLTRIGKANG